MYEMLFRRESYNEEELEVGGMTHVGAVCSPSGPTLLLHWFHVMNQVTCSGRQLQWSLAKCIQLVLPGQLLFAVCCIVGKFHTSTFSWPSSAWCPSAAVCQVFPNTMTSVNVKCHVMP